jgi:hypothetical protein
MECNLKELTMKLLLILSIFGVVLSCGIAAAGEPVINYNVHVGHNLPQCNSTWEGRMGPYSEEILSGIGENAVQTSPVVRSCTGCALNNQSQDCVCKTCYDYFDN